MASHAQKYFIRLNSMKKDRKRASIHDITAPQQQLQQIKAQVRVRWRLKRPPPAPCLRALPPYLLLHGPRGPSLPPTRAHTSPTSASTNRASSRCPQVRQQQLAAKQQKEAAMLARQRAQQLAQAERQAERQAQAERDRAKHAALETQRQQQQELEELQMEFEEQEELYLQQQEQEQQQQQQQDQHASAFAVPSMQQPFDWGLHGVVPSLGEQPQQPPCSRSPA